MATLEELSTALRNADAAGDADAARALAAEIGKMNQPPQQRGAMDQLLGTTGPRYHTWPERAVRAVGQGVMSAATLPGDVAVGKVQIPSREGVPGSAPEEAGQVKMQPNAVAEFLGASKDNRWEAPGAGSPFARATELAAIASPVNPAIRVGDKAFPGEIRALGPAKPKVPTTRELASSGGTDISAAKASGFESTGAAAANLSQKIQRGFFEDGIHPIDAPATFAKLKDLESAPSGSIFTAANLQSLRESLGATAQNFNPAAARDQLAASRAIKQLDGFLPSIDPKDVLAGTPAATAKLFERGRGNYAAAMRSNDLSGVLDRANTGILEKAQTRAQSSNSGRNIDNTIRQKLASLLEKPKEVSGFSEAELDALNKAVVGGPARNSARVVGNYLGGGGGLGQAVATGIGAGAGVLATGSPVGAAIGATIPAAVGVSAKNLSNALAKRSLRGVDELVRKRSPLFLERVENPSSAVLSPERRAAFARALMVSSQSDD